MTFYEIVTVVLSSLAILTSLIAIVRQSSFSARQIALEEEQARLAQLQREMLEAEASAAARAQIDLDIYAGSRDGRFTISNVGGAPASDVNVRWLDNRPQFPGQEEERKLPVKVLRPGKSVELIVAFSMGSPSDFHVEASWKDPDGTQQTDDFHIHAY
jgi:hypothetical protein